MRFLRVFFLAGCAIGIVAAAACLASWFGVADRLIGVFFRSQAWLPAAIDFEQFLVILTIASWLLVGVAFGSSALSLLRLGVARQRAGAQTGAARREVTLLKEGQDRRCDQLISLAQLLAKRLDKRVILQAAVESVSRMMSVAKASSLVSIWLVHIETETIRFETGLYCDETMFTKTEFQQTEVPFAQVISTAKPWVLPAWDQGPALVRREKVSQLGSATSLIIAPLIIEDSVLGVLTIFCHPDMLKQYEGQGRFYEAVLGELTLGVATAIQGEVALYDRLTGVYNREYTMKRLIQEIDRSNRFQLPLSLLMLDIDNFKQVNDTLGHPQGDAALRIVARLIKKEVRAIDLVGRYGGEEFFVVLPETGYGEDVVSATGALAVAERIRKAVDDEFCGLQKPLNLTVSIGAVVRRFPEDRAMDERDLIRLADEQLYRSKTTGKNKVSAFVAAKPQAVS